jgi:TolB-like protein/DNA-binding winged helix-turn-helix (wHTH) protein
MRADFRIDDWIIRPRRDRIERGDEIVHIHHKPMAVLEYLAAHAGEVVARDELFDAVWPGVVVTDDALTQCVVELRKAFGESAHDAQIIRTIPRVGFCLVPPVMALPEERASLDEQPGESRASVAGLMKIMIPAGMIAAVAVLLALTMHWYLAESTETVPIVSMRPPPSIAVLPFTDLSEGQDQEYFADGVSEELLNLLAKIPGLRVIARTSSFSYKGKDVKITDVARELNVGYVLEGSVRKANNQVRITVQLIDARTDTHMWSESYDHELTAENLFAIQSDISKVIAEALQANLSPEQERRINAMPTDNLLAYDAYLRGRQLMASRESDDLQLAAQAFGEAVELDPQFALAWVAVADSHELLTLYGSMNEKDANPVIEDAINRALMIDDTLGEAYTSLGTLLEDSDWSGAEAAYQRAIELSPNYARAYHWYSVSMRRNRLRIDEGIDLVLKAFELDPRSSVIGIDLGNAYEERGLYSMAEHQYKKVLELDPDFVVAYSALASLYTFTLSRYPEALVNARKADEIDPGGLRVTHALIYLELGDLAAAQGVRERMADFDANHYGVDFVDTLISISNNNPAGAWEAINRLLPKIRHMPGFEQSIGQFALILGDTARAREIYLSANPGWLDPSQWQGLVERHNTRGCVVSWLLMNTGDEDLGAELLQQTTTLLTETFPAVMEHVDFYFTEFCHLTAGDTEKALQSIETQLAHNHLWGWQIFHQLPMYDLIRQEPRYLAAMAERERRIAQQREEITRMDGGSGQ